MIALATVFAVILSSVVLSMVGRGLVESGEPDVKTAPERVPFAGGTEPSTHAWGRYHVRYYVMALVFVAFDMEMVFMYPWAVVFVREGVIALIEMAWFIVVLLLGVLYAWREGALHWA